MATVQEQIQKYKTALFDALFPNTNQTRNCYQNYLDFYRCQKALSATGKDVALFNGFHKVYKYICPMSWVNRWDERREAGTFAGKI